MNNKKTSVTLICIILTLAFFVFGAFVVSKNFDPDIFGKLKLPPTLPSMTGLLVICGFLSLVWGSSLSIVFAQDLKPRAKRNLVMNSLILFGTLFSWHFILLCRAMPAGALALAIAALLLAVIVWFMYLLVHRNAGYLFTPILVWIVFMIYLSIRIVMLNR